MAYCTLEQVLNRAPGLSGDSDYPSRVQAGIAFSDSIINGRLQNKFSVPFSAPIPTLIATIAVDLAAAHAITSSFSGFQSADQMEFARAMREQAESILNEISVGTLHLADATTKQTIPSQSPPIFVTGQRDNSIERMDLLGRFGPKRP